MALTWKPFVDQRVGVVFEVFVPVRDIPSRAALVTNAWSIYVPYLTLVDSTHDRR